MPGSNADSRRAGAPSGHRLWKAESPPYTQFTGAAAEAVPRGRSSPLSPNTHDADPAAAGPS